MTDMQQQSLLRGTDCCCRPTWVGTHISALVAVVCSICSAATLLTVLRGVGILAYGTCMVSRGKTLDGQPRVEGGSVQRVD